MKSVQEVVGTEEKKWAKYDETCGEWVTYGMRQGATELKHLELLGLEPTHVRWMSCHMCETREKMCVCVTLCAFDEVFCLHTPSRARHSVMSVREICEEKSTWLKKRL